MNQSPIEFRAWDGKKMIYTDQDRNGLLMTIGGRVSASNDEDFTLMQFTGLCDKKGKKIFVGDVVKYWEAGHLGFICFDAGGFVKKDHVNDEECLGAPMWTNRSFIENECEIIGNIFENPELVKTR